MIAATANPNANPTLPAVNTIGTTTNINIQNSPHDDIHVLNVAINPVEIEEYLDFTR
jgi:hypothetical protein